mmetsp:Transcript_39392/g.78751  ORF Transcript_39392/g.78751 Transcript_39392/m.78751 type:complete len:211 (-) Transcript_39392:912-1544(-)
MAGSAACSHACLVMRCPWLPPPPLRLWAVSVLLTSNARATHTYLAEGRLTLSQVPELAFHSLPHVLITASAHMPSVAESHSSTSFGPFQRANASSTAVVVRRDERHLSNRDSLLLLAQRDIQLGADLVVRRLDVCHPDALLEDGTVRAARDHAHLLALGIHHRSAGARGCSIDDETGTLPRGRLVGDLAEDALRADETARLGTTPLGNHP